VNAAHAPPRMRERDARDAGGPSRARMLANLAATWAVLMPLLTPVPERLDAVTNRNDHA